MPSCSRARTAPLTEIEDVEAGSAKVGPCGDVVFRKTDGSLWLRAASGDGSLVSLAPAGPENFAGDFDATGRYLALSRSAPEQAVVRDLESGVEIILPVAANFGFNAETRAPIVFTCSDGVRVLHADGALGPVIAGTAGLICGAHGFAPYGKKMIAFDDAGTGAVLVDLARETAVRLDIDYVAGDGSMFGRRADDLIISRDGGVVLHQIATWTPCGDTYCSDADGYDIISTATGKRTQHAGHGAGGVANAFDYVGARANALVAGNGRAESIDTSTGVYVERADATCIGLQQDGTLVLQRSDQSGTRVSTARPGETEEKEWFTVGTWSTDVVTWPVGRRAVILERTKRVEAQDGGTWGAGEYGDLVVKDEKGSEIGRHPHFSHLEPIAFPTDGAAILLALRYASAPPASAASSDDLGLVRSLVRVAADGSLKIVADEEITARDAIELDERSIATFTWDHASPRSASFKIYDLSLTKLRKTITAPRLRVVPSFSPTAPTGVVALEDVASDAWKAPAKLWHGVADR